jgi:hypothetical protein|nr:MAG TPA: putative transcriptional regulator [Caudoviricetes sp.]
MNRVKELREKMSLTQTELAAKAGVSQRYIAFVETGKRTPSLKRARLISSIVGASIEDVFFLPQ